MTVRDLLRKDVETCDVSARTAPRMNAVNDSPRPAGTARSAPDGLLPALPNTDLKLAMAASGALFSGYVLVHMIGMTHFLPTALW